MNTLQKTTKNGRPIINRSTKLPEYQFSVHNRLNTIKRELGYVNNKPSHDQIWASICVSVSILTI
jgi:hypothetical protein